jgi:MFS family permease
VLILAPLVFRAGRVRFALGGACAVGALGFFVLGLANAVPPYIAGFLLVALVISAMVPAINTLIASNVTRSRRGTGFGVAASVQALSFAVGPAGATLFAAISFQLGFILLAGVFLALGAVLFVAVREVRVVA